MKYNHRGLVFRGQSNKELVLYLLTGRHIYKTLAFLNRVLNSKLCLTGLDVIDKYF